MAELPHTTEPAVPVPGQALDPAFRQLDQVAAQLRTPPAQARIWLGQWLGQWAEAVKTLIGYAPWLGGLEPGVVTAVDTTTHRCTLVTGERPEPFPDVEYFPVTRPPIVGREYAMRTAVALQQSTGRPDADKIQVVRPRPQRRWIVVPAGATRWLYRKQAGETDLIRYGWPPPPVDHPEQWVVEVVHTGLDPSWVLFGSSTPSNGATEIVLSSGDGATYTTPGLDPTDAGYSTLTGTRYHHLGDMGFGDVVRDYNVAPADYAQLTAIANGGTNTTAQRNAYTHSVAKGEEFPTWSGSGCSTVCTGTVPGEPDQNLPYQLIWDEAAGTYGTVAAFSEATQSVAEHELVDFNCHSEGCATPTTHFITCCAPAWDYRVEGWTANADISGAWRYGARQAEALVGWNTEPLYENPDPQYWFQQTGANNRVEVFANDALGGLQGTLISPIGDPTIDGASAWPDLMFVAWDRETAVLSIWGIYFPSDGSQTTLRRWTSAAPTWAPFTAEGESASWLYLVSQDGADVLAARGDSFVTVATVDGGDNWVDVPDVPSTAPGGGGIPNWTFAAKFVEDMGTAV